MRTIQGLAIAAALALRAGALPIEPRASPTKPASNERRLRAKPLEDSK